MQVFTFKTCDWSVVTDKGFSLVTTGCSITFCIRKVIECIFSHQELRALDDLLPERKSSRRKSGVKKATLRKIDENDDNRSVDSFILMKKKRRNPRYVSKCIICCNKPTKAIIWPKNRLLENIQIKHKKHSSRRGSGYDPHFNLDSELEDLMSYEPKPPKYKKVPSLTNVKNLARAPSSLPDKVVLLFLR